MEMDSTWATAYTQLFAIVRACKYECLAQTTDWNQRKNSGNTSMAKSLI